MIPGDVSIVVDDTSTHYEDLRLKELAEQAGREKTAFYAGLYFGFMAGLVFSGVVLLIIRLLVHA